MSIPRDKDLRSIFDHLYDPKDDDPFSRSADMRARLKISERFTRGNVKMQNNGMMDADMNQELEKRVNELFAEMKKFRK